MDASRSGRCGGMQDAPVGETQDVVPVASSDAAAGEGRRTGSVTVVLSRGIGQWAMNIVEALTWWVMFPAYPGAFVFAVVMWPARWAVIGLFAAAGVTGIVASRRTVPRLKVSADQLRLYKWRHEWRMSREWTEFDRHRVGSVSLRWNPAQKEKRRFYDGGEAYSGGGGYLEIKGTGGEHLDSSPAWSQRELRAALRALKHYGWPAVSIVTKAT